MKKFFTNKGFINTLVVIVLVILFLILAKVDINRVVEIGKQIGLNLYDLFVTLIVQPVQRLVGR